MTSILLARAHEVREQISLPARAKAARYHFVSSPATAPRKNENSRNAIEHQVKLIRTTNEYADVHALFLEEDPRIEKC